MPFPYDAIEQVSVELAPFDVVYGGFTACNINAVTKSGGNRFSGTAFYDYTDDSLSGDKLEGDAIDLGSFEEKRYGVAFGGPIIQDRLFFFAAYEKHEGANIFERGPADESVGVPVLGVTRAQLDRIAQIARDVYGYEPGGFPPSLATDDEKYLVKLDWNVNDNHRASYTYSFNDGFNNSEADDAATNIEFANHFYERGAELTSHVAQLFSNWTENFSTEFRYAYQELDNRQIPLGGTDFGEVQIHTFNDPDGAGPISPQRANVYLGADDSRHANDLKYDTTSYKLAAPTGWAITSSPAASSVKSSTSSTCSSRRPKASISSRRKDSRPCAAPPTRMDASMRSKPAIRIESPTRMPRHRTFPRMRPRSSATRSTRPTCRTSSRSDR
jgi:hypothetical protein